MTDTPRTESSLPPRNPEITIVKQGAVTWRWTLTWNYPESAREPGGPPRPPVRIPASLTGYAWTESMARAFAERTWRGIVRDWEREQGAITYVPV